LLRVLQTGEFEALGFQNTSLTSNAKSLYVPQMPTCRTLNQTAGYLDRLVVSAQIVVETASALPSTNVWLILCLGLKHFIW